MNLILCNTLILVKIDMVIKFFDFVSNNIFFALRIHRLTRRAANVSRNDHIFSNHEPYSSLRIQQMRQTIQRKLQNKIVYLLKSIICYGIRTINLSRKPSRYSRMSQCNAPQIIPCRHPSTSFPNNFSGCKRKSRLAYLRRLCTSINSYCTTIICQRRHRCRTGRNGLCIGFHHNRFVSFAFSLGPVSRKESSNKTAYAYRRTRPDTHFYMDIRRKTTRCQYPGRANTGTECNIFDRPRIHRFLTFTFDIYRKSIFYYPGKIKYAIQAVYIQIPPTKPKAFFPIKQ